MPYESTHSKLEDFLARALSNEEIRDGANQADLKVNVLKEKFLRPNLQEKAPKLWEAAAHEIETYDRLETEYNAHVTALRNEEERLRRSYLRISERALLVLLVGVSPFILLSGLLIFLSALFQVGLLSSPATLNSLLSGSVFSSAGTPVLIVILLFSITALLVYIAVCRYLHRRYSEAKGQYESRLTEIRRQLESNALGDRLRTAEQEVEKAVIEKRILSELRLIIADDLEPSYETTLTISDAPGLAEVFDPAFEITTESRSRIRRLLDHMPGGSIGVAGPRGVGKTTLLGSFCSTALTTKLKGRPVLSIMTSAPVEYDSREFILHIFSSVCHRVLEIKGKDPRQPWSYMTGIQKPPITFLSTIISLKEALAVILLGLFLMATLLLSNQLTNLSDFFREFFFGLGLFLVFMGVVGLLIQVYQVLQQRRQTQRQELQKNELYGNDPLVEEAYQRLHEIQFQQSFSSGWAGSLKGSLASVAVETTAEAAIELSRNQMSLPEIVDRYRDFLTRASKEYEIIIGIDELDKIGSDEQAHRFLNEIKALFGLEKCFYLISVSESAMSSFERRGLPFRDVFDSSFDAIVHADYLTLDKAQRLLRRRVIGVPVPFLDFCHCVAGGLPRDLIRIFRALYEEHVQANAGESSLTTLCGSLITADLKSKLRATSIAAKDVALESEVNELFSRIRDLESSLQTPDRLSTISERLLANYRRLLEVASPTEPGNQSEPSATATKRENLTTLSAELGVYLYYSATLLEYFGQEDFRSETLRAAEDSGALEQLARARQLFAISPHMAEAGITAFREKYNMGVPQSVSANVVHTR
jgi:membrane protein implicated in regulation of membrane protease activity